MRRRRSNALRRQLKIAKERAPERDLIFPFLTLPKPDSSFGKRKPEIDRATSVFIINMKHAASGKAAGVTQIDYDVD